MKRDAAPRWTLPLAGLAAAAVFAAFAVRWAGAPGPWDTDSYRCAELAAGADPVGDPRGLRVPFLAMVRAALGDGRPARWGCLPGCALSALAVVPLFAALLRTAGARAAVLGAALWAVMPIDLDECSKLSSDVPTSLAAASALWALVRASESPRPLRWLAAAGVFLGLGAAMKETLVLGAVGFAGAAAWTGIGARGRAARFAVVGGCAAAAMLAMVLVTSPERLAVASSHAGAAPWAVRLGDGRFAKRLLVDVPATLLTATGAYGSLFLAALPLLARMPFRAARGDVVASAACGATLAFVLLPIGSPAGSGWPLLPSEPRFFLWCVPLLAAAVASGACGDSGDEPDAPPVAGLERWLAIAAAVPAFLAGGDIAIRVLSAAGAVCAAMPALAQRAPVRAAAAALPVLLAAACAWPRIGAETWVTAASAAGLAAAVAVAPGGLRAAPFAALGVAICGAAVSAQPYGGWELPPLRGPVLCDPFTAHHLRVAWRGAGGAELRTAASGEEAALSRDPSPPHAVAAVGTALRDALASETSWETGGDFGEFRLFVRRR